MVIDHEYMSIDCDNIMCKKGTDNMMIENGRMMKNSMSGGMNGMMME